MKINNRKDILLLLLYSPGVTDEINEPISGRTRLVKILFLFRKEVFDSFRKNIELDIDKFYNFYAWDYGPFSVEVYDDLLFFSLRGFIKTDIANEAITPEAASEYNEWIQEVGMQDDDVSIEYLEEIFSLTAIGKSFTEKLYENLTENQKKILRDFKKKLMSVHLRALLRYVYERYPDMTTKSKIKAFVY